MGDERREAVLARGTGASAWRQVLDFGKYSQFAFACSSYMMFVVLLPVMYHMDSGTAVNVFP